jgi:hypothetical protein
MQQKTTGNGGRGWKPLSTMLARVETWTCQQTPMLNKEWGRLPLTVKQERQPHCQLESRLQQTIGLLPENLETHAARQLDRTLGRWHYYTSKAASYPQTASSAQHNYLLNTLIGSRFQVVVVVEENNHSLLGHF